MRTSPLVLRLLMGWDGGTGGAGGLAGAPAGSPAAAGFSAAGLQHLAAKLRNGSVTPDGKQLQPADGKQLQPADGSGRYASFEDSVGSKQPSHSLCPTTPNADKVQPYPAGGRLRGCWE